jgi:hypothetical protein
MRFVSVVKTVLVFAGCMAFCAGCGKNLDTVLVEIGQQVDSLKAAGAPDTLLTEIKVLHYKAKNNVQRGNGREAQKQVAQMQEFIGKIKSQFAVTATSSKKSIDSLAAQFRTEAAAMTGDRVKVINRVLHEADSLLKANLMLKANSLLKEFAVSVPQLQENEKQAQLIAPKVIGAWRRLTEEKDKKIGSDYKKTEEYEIARDNKFVITETMKGNQDETVYYDYQFISYGDYSLNGDTINMWVKRMKGYNKNKILVNEKTDEWKSVGQPGFDSLVTDGSQDRFATYGELKQHFKKLK